ncbi:MAG: DsbA family protein [Hyphomicrobiales bacterium]|nr:DsbA family protein [Hyphomicrobiales bacterium]MCP5370179.1 DsbA family protein [Hyphomicrobiales bacterium]
MDDKEIIFVGDPMCSWCWGFSPALEGMAEMARGRARLTVVTGGLRAGETRAMDDRSKEYVRHHWEEVHKASGQPFDFTFFERDGFVYDTEPACRAVVILRTASPEAAVPYFVALHRAFYAEGRDVTDGGVLADLAAPFGLPRDTFLDAFNDPNIRAATMADFTYARSLGVTGFPTVVCRQGTPEGDQWGYLTVGYRPLGALAPLLEQWLAAD